MKIAKVKIWGYRCLAYFEVDFTDYTAAIGANGSGKSSLLYALDWFFNDSRIEQSDLTYGTNEKHGSCRVEVQFDDLQDYDREALGAFGQGSTFLVGRSWTPNETGFYARAHRSPEAQRIREIPDLKTLRTEYNTLREKQPGLLETPIKAEILQALDDWELKQTTSELEIGLESLKAKKWDDTEFGQTFRMILIPAADKLAADVGQGPGKSLVLETINEVLRLSTETAKGHWETENETHLEKLRSDAVLKVREGTTSYQTSLNGYLQKLVPSASVSFQAEANTDVGLNIDLSPKVTTGTLTVDLERRGHGVKRAVLIAALQARAEQEAGSHDAKSATLLALEEPELYQHPIRARTFARVLADLSKTENVQVAVATHSSYFVNPALLGSLRRFTPGEQSTVAHRSTGESVETNYGITRVTFNKFIDREAGGAFAEGFFADLVILTEGPTDHVVLQSVAELTGQPLDVHGIAVIPVGGKTALPAAYAVLSDLGIPTYVVADEDHNKEGTDQQKTTRHKQTMTILNTILGKKAAASVPLTGATNVNPRYTLFGSDMEAELELWTEFKESIPGDLRKNKDAGEYRLAVLNCPKETVPQVFQQILIEARQAVHSQQDVPS